MQRILKISITNEKASIKLINAADKKETLLKRLKRLS